LAPFRCRSHIIGREGETGSTTAMQDGHHDVIQLTHMVLGCRAILGVLAGTGTLEAQELAQQKLSDVEQQLRFAQYEAGRRGGDAGAPQDMEDVVEDDSWRVRPEVLFPSCLHVSKAPQ
jgi:hypothetical protein